MPTLQYTIVGRRMKFSEAINTDTIVPRTMADLGNNERRMLKAMLTEPKSVWTLPKLLEACNWKDQAHVAGAGLNFQDAGVLEIEEKSSKHISLGQEGIRAAEIGLLESRLMNWLLEQDPAQSTMAKVSETFEKAEG